MVEVKDAFSTGKVALKDLVYHSKKLELHPLGGRKSAKESVVQIKVIEVPSGCSVKSGLEGTRVGTGGQ